VQVIRTVVVGLRRLLADLLRWRVDVEVDVDVAVRLLDPLARGVDVGRGIERPSVVLARLGVECDERPEAVWVRTLQKVDGLFGRATPFLF
jgi:hypothetical protein